MKKCSRMFSVLMAAVIMVFVLSPKAQAAEIVYDLDISGVSAYKNISGDVLRLDNLVNDDFLVSFDIENNGTSLFDNVLCAYYSHDGQFMGQEVAFSLAEAGESEAMPPFEINNSDGHIGYIKIFIFRSFGEMTPITECIELYPAQSEHSVMWLGQQKDTARGTEIYVMGDEYHGWYLLDDSIDKEALLENGIKYITVEKGVITSLEEGASGITEFGEYNGNIGFFDSEGTEYSFDPEGYDVFAERDDHIEQYDKIIRSGASVAAAVKDGYVTDIYLCEGFAREYEGFVEVISSQAVINETTQAAEVTVRHLDTGKTDTYDLPVREHEGGYGCLISDGTKEVLMPLENGAIFPEGSVRNYYMRGDEMVLGEPDQDETYFVEDTDVVFKGKSAWEFAGEDLKMNSKTRIYFHRDGGKVIEVTGYKNLNLTVYGAKWAFASENDMIIREIYIMGGELDESSIPQDDSKPADIKVGKDNIIYYKGERDIFGGGISITYYHKGMEKSALLGDGVNITMAGSYAVSFDKSGRIDGARIVGENRPVAMVKESYFMTNAFSDGYKLYAINEDTEIYDVSEGISTGEIEAGDFVESITDENGKLLTVFIQIKNKPQPPKPQPVTEDVLYYAGVFNRAGDHMEIEYYMDGYMDYIAVADGLELYEKGAYTFTLEGDVITSMTAAGIKGDIEAKSSRYVKMYGEKYYFSDDMVIYDVSDGVSKVETFTVLDEIIVITNIDNEASIIFIVKPYVYEPSDPVVPEPVVNTSLVAYYYDWGMDKNGFTIQVAVDGESKTYEYVGETDIGLFEVGMYVLEINSDDKVVALTSADGHIIEGKVAEVTDSYVTIGEQKVYFADKYVAAELDGLGAVEITEEDEVIAVLNEDGCITVVYVK